MPVRAGDRIRLGIQPVNATAWLNISAGVRKSSVFRGLSFSLRATALSLACEYVETLRLPSNAPTSAPSGCPSSRYEVAASSATLLLRLGRASVLHRPVESAANTGRSPVSASSCNRVKSLANPGIGRFSALLADATWPEFRAFRYPRRFGAAGRSSQATGLTLIHGRCLRTT